MNDARPYVWEASYPPGVRWDAPIRRLTLTGLLDEAVARFADRPPGLARALRLGRIPLGGIPSGWVWEALKLCS